MEMYVRRTSDYFRVERVEQLQRKADVYRETYTGHVISQFMVITVKDLLQSILSYVS
jgi:hypothetical protein